MQQLRMLALSKARALLSDLADDGEPTLLLRHSNPKAVLVPYKTWVAINSELDDLKALVAARAPQTHTQPRTIDFQRKARLLSQVIDLAESLPYRPRRTLAYPPLRRRPG